MSRRILGVALALVACSKQASPPSALSYAVNPAVYTVGVAITPDVPTSSGGTVASYSVTPALPAGLALNPTTGVVSGTPTSATALAGYVVTASNGGGSANVTLSITVNPSLPPVVVDDTATTSHGSPVTVDVLANDSDPQGLALTLVSVSAPASGSAAVVQNKVQYTPPGASFLGRVKMTYVVTDGLKQSTGNLTIACTQTVTLHGRAYDAAVPQAQISADVDGRSFVATAAADGTFAIDVVAAEPTAMVKLNAQGAAAGSQGFVKLVSLVDGFGALCDQSSAGQLDRASAPRLNVTNVSTARYALLKQANGGAEPATVKDTQQAEKAVGTSDVLDLAAAIKVAIDAPSTYALPGSCASTLDLATSAKCLSDFTAKVVQAAGSTQPLEAARAATVADPQIAGAFKASTLPASYYAIGPAIPGYLARGGTRLSFDPGANTGKYIASDQIRSFTWSISAGKLVLSFANPVIYAGPYGLDQVKDPAAVACVHECRSSSTEGCWWVSGTSTINEIDYAMVSSGELVDWAQETDIGTLAFSSFEVTTSADVACPNGTYHPASQALPSTPTDAQLRDTARAPALAFDDPLTAGTWAMLVYYDPGPTFDGTPIPPQMEGDVVTFNAAHTGSAAISGLTFAWSVGAGGVLTMVFDGGYGTQTVRILDVDGPIYGVYSEFSNGTGLVGAAEDWAFKRDPGFSLASSRVATDASHYWQSMINTWMPAFWKDGVPLFDLRFGWQIDGAGGAKQLQFALQDINNDQVDEKVLKAYRFTGGVDGQGRLTLTSNDAGVCSAGNPACKRRVYWPLGISADGNQIFVLEQAFLGSPLHYGMYFPARLNAFERWAVPAADLVQGL